MTTRPRKPATKLNATDNVAAKNALSGTLSCQGATGTVKAILAQTCSGDNWGNQPPLPPIPPPPTQYPTCIATFYFDAWFPATAFGPPGTGNVISRQFTTPCVWLVDHWDGTILYDPPGPWPWGAVSIYPGPDHCTLYASFNNGAAAAAATLAQPSNPVGTYTSAGLHTVPPGTYCLISTASVTW